MKTHRTTTNTKRAQDLSEIKIEQFIKDREGILTVEPVYTKGLFVMARVNANPEEAGIRSQLPVNNHTITFVLSGTLTLYCGTSEYIISENEFFYVGGSSIFDSYSVSPDFTSSTILFGKKFLEYMERNTSFTGKELREPDSFFRVTADESLQLFLRNQYMQIESLARTHHDTDGLNTFISLQVAAFTSSMFALARKTGKEHNLPSKPHYIYSRYIRLLHESLSYKNNINYYAKLLDITPKYLSVTTKTAANKNALEIRDEMLLETAKRLIAETDMNMFEISDRLGFDSQSNFARFFKKMENSTPSKYKKTNKK